MKQNLRTIQLQIQTSSKDRMTFNEGTYSLPALSLKRREPPFLFHSSVLFQYLSWVKTKQKSEIKETIENTSGTFLGLRNRASTENGSRRTNQIPTSMTILAQYLAISPKKRKQLLDMKLPLLRTRLHNSHLLSNSETIGNCWCLSL